MSFHSSLPLRTLAALSSDRLGRVEGWRIIATALFGAAGIALALIVMAKVRERTSSAGYTAVSGAVVLAAIAVVGVLMLTVLAAPVAWGIVIALGAAVTVMVLAS